MKFLLILIISLSLLLSSCAKLEEAGFKIGEKLGQKLTGEEVKAESVDLFCIERAQSLIQNDVILLHVGNDWYLKEYVFANGEVDDTLSIRYRLGDKEGENVGYMYPRNLIESNHVGYTSLEVRKDGTIAGDFEFRVTLVLEKTDDPVVMLDNTTYGRVIESQTYTVVKREYVSCHLPY